MATKLCHYSTTSICTSFSTFQSVQYNLRNAMWSFKSGQCPKYSTGEGTYRSGVATPMREDGGSVDNSTPYKFKRQIWNTRPRNIQETKRFRILTSAKPSLIYVVVETPLPTSILKNEVLNIL